MKNKHLAVVIITAIISLLLFWMPFKLNVSNWMGINFGSTGMNRIVQNFDGINFLIVAKTWYNPKLIETNYQDVLSGRRALYFSAHYPGLPALITLSDKITSGPNALLLSILISNLLLSVGMYYFAYVFTKDKMKAMWVAIFSLFFPARMLADRAVGSNEPLFIFFLLMSLAFNYQKWDWYSALMGVGAVLTRSPGILLFGGYLLQIMLSSQELRVKVKKILPYLLIPLSLLALWTFYGYQFGSFWTYFQVGGNLNIELPFSVFESRKDWVSGIWNEDLIYLFVLIVAGIVGFAKKYKNTGAMWLIVLYGTFVMCVAHRDLARYSLPIMPLIILTGADYLNNKYVKIGALILLIPIFMYAWQFVIANYQPIMDWTHYL